MKHDRARSVKTEPQTPASKTRCMLSYYFAVLVILFILSIYATRESFREGLIASWDYPAHLIRAQVFDENFNLRDLGIWAWYNGWYLGFAPYMFYPPGFFIVVSMVKNLSFGLFSIDLSMRIILALLYALFPVAIWWMSRNIGFDRRTSILAAIFSLDQKGIAPGIDTLYLYGLITQYFGIILIMFFLGLLRRALDGSVNDSIAAGLVLGFIVVSHIIAALYAFIILCLYVFVLFFWRRRIPLCRLFLVYSIGFLVSLFWLLPFFSSQSLFGPSTGFGSFSFFELIQKLVVGQMLSNPLTFFSVLAGIVYAVYMVLKRTKNCVMLSFLLVLTGFTLFISSDTMVSALRGLGTNNPAFILVYRALNSLLQTRALVFLGVLFPLFAGIGVDGALKLAGKYFKGRNMKLFSGLLIALILCFYALEQDRLSSAIKTINDDYASESRPWKDVFRWLLNHADAGSVIKAQADFTKYNYPGFLSLDSMINLETGLATINGNQIEAVQQDLLRHAGELERINTQDDAVSRTLLHRYRVGYILLAGLPEINKPFLEKMYSKDGFIIYKVGYLGLQEYDLEYYQHNHNSYRLKVKVNKAGRVALPIQYNDHWNAWVNGTAATVYRSGDGLIALELPDGSSEILLSFERKAVESAAVAVSFLTVVCSLAALVRGIRKF